jgi:hypothetical protein
MAGTRQNPISDWQPTSSVGQSPLGSTPFPPTGYGPAPAAKPRRRRLVLVTVVTAVVIVAGLIAGIALINQPKGSLSLPKQLLGLAKVTSASAGRVASRLRTQEQAGARGKLSGVVAGVYGSPTVGWLAVSGGGICGTCSAKSAAALRSNLAAHGYPDAATFPAGPKGGVLACGSQASQGSTLIRCTWVDGGTAGDVLFSAGAASDLADGAAKTNQVRTAIEH